MRGDIVRMKEFKFLDGNLDVEGFEREGIILFEENDNDEEYVWICPMTSHYKPFRRNPDKYYLLPLFTKNGNRFLFAKLSSVMKVKKNLIISCVGKLDNFYIMNIMALMKSYYTNYGNDEYYENIIHNMEEKSKGVK